VIDSVLTGNVLHIPIHEEEGTVVGCLELDIRHPSIAHFVVTCFLLVNTPLA
jgi:hypothetical protein